MAEPNGFGISRDRRIVVVSLATVSAVSWAYVLVGAGTDQTAVSGAGVMMEMATVWSPEYFLLMLVMMVAMMLPSASPTILLYTAVNRKFGERGHPTVPTGLFAVGYLLAWGGFSVLATSLQGALDHFALLNPMIASASVPFGAALLIGTGVYQMTPLKHACLRHCQAPIDFLARHWHPGKAGAIRMGPSTDFSASAAAGH